MKPYFFLFFRANSVKKASNKEAEEESSQPATQSPTCSKPVMEIEPVTSIPGPDIQVQQPTASMSNQVTNLSAGGDRDDSSDGESDMEDSSSDEICEIETNPNKDKIGKQKGKHKTCISTILELNYSFIEVKKEKKLNGEEEAVMYCKLCRKHNCLPANKRGTWVTEGYKLLRKDKVKAHLHSEQHKRALSLDVGSQTMISTEVISEDMECAQAIFECLKFLADKNHALEEFGSLIDLCLRTGSKALLPLRKSPSATYTSPTAVHQMMDALSSTIDDTLLADIRNSPAYSLILDEVSDVSSTNNLGVIIKYIDSEGLAQIRFLADKELIRGTGEAVKEAVMAILEEKNLEPSKCFNLTSDGASAFSGKHNGAAALLAAEVGPVIVVHCHDHRLALACRDAFHEVPGIDKASETLDALHKFYEYSTVSAATLKELQDIYKQSHWRVQQAKHHRWLSYDKAVTTVLQGHSILLEDLENTALSSQERKRKDDAQGLEGLLGSELVVRSLVLLGDILPHLTTLSLVFQKNAVDLSVIEPLTKKTCTSLSEKKRKCGAWGKQLENHKFRINKMNCSEVEFERKIKLPLIDALITNIQTRFANAEILSKMGGLVLPVQDVQVMDALPSLYKHEDISDVADYFQLDKDSCFEEWTKWLEWLKSTEIPQENRWPSTLPFLAKLLLDKTSDKSNSLREMFPNLAIIYGIIATLSLSSAEVERLFSHLKLIKSDRRASLSNTRLNQLLNIKLNLDSNNWNETKLAASKRWMHGGKVQRRFTGFCRRK